MPFRLLVFLLSVSIFSPLFADRADSLYHRAAAFVESGDSTAALRLAGAILDEFPQDYRTYLLRGKLLLAAGDLVAAREDFKNTRFSPDDVLRAKAHVGEGDILYHMPGKKNLAVTSYHIATQVDPGCCEASLKLFITGTELNDARGYRTAAGALADLLCVDPTYHNIYPVWRDSLLDKTPEEIDDVVSCMTKYVENHPERGGWLVGLAKIVYEEQQIERALELLGEARVSGGDYSHAEANLLEARCLLAQGDTSGFADSYRRALDAAGRDGNFERLVLEAETIFTPEETSRAALIKTPEEWTVFFRTFWKTRDPDPITPANERLVNHYCRLYEALVNYRNLHPHARGNMSNSYFRLVSMLRLQEEDGWRGLRPENPMTEYGEYEYDPDLMFARNRRMNFDQRGLLYVRHGPPDEIRKPESSGYDGPPPQAEIWRYDEVFFPFQYMLGGGSYQFTPYAFPDAGDIGSAMATDTFEDEFPHLKQAVYGVNFRGTSGTVELEMYQSIPVEETDIAEPPQAVLATFDSTWAESTQTKTLSSLVAYDGVEHYASVNSMDVPAVRQNVVMRFDIPQKRCVRRYTLALREFPNPEYDLSASGIVLGDVPRDGRTFHNRLGVDLLPRPSMTFPVTGTIMAYMEIYGLKPGDSGKRSYFAEVTVSLLEAYEAPLEKLFGKLAWWSEKRSGQLTLTFERSLDRSGGGPVPETFQIDTSFLVPGKYRLDIDIQDDNTRQVASSSARFVIED